MKTDEPVLIDYTNWRGERSKRLVRIISWRFGATDWHPEPGWLFRAHCYTSGGEREFSLMGLHGMQVAPRVQSTASVDNVIGL